MLSKHLHWAAVPFPPPSISESCQFTFTCRSYNSLVKCTFKNFTIDLSLPCSSY
jgi:hypothetical protein